MRAVGRPRRRACVRNHRHRSSAERGDQADLRPRRVGTPAAEGDPIAVRRERGIVFQRGVVREPNPLASGDAADVEMNLARVARDVRDHLSVRGERGRACFALRGEQQGQAAAANRGGRRRPKPREHADDGRQRQKGDDQPADHDPRARRPRHRHDFATDAGRQDFTRLEIALQIFQVVAEILHRLVTVLGIFDERPADDPADVARQRRVDVGDRSRCVLDDRGDHRDGRVALKRPLARGHLIQDHAEGKDVGPMIERLALGLFGRHVGRGPDDSAVAGHVLGGRKRRDAERRRLRLVQLRQTEVENLDPVVGADHDVGRLEIPMRNPSGVSGRQRVRQRDGNLQQPLQRESVFRDDLLQRFALDELHRQEGDAVRLFDRVDRDDAGMIEGGDALRLAREAGTAMGIGGATFEQHFERDVAMQLRIARAIHLAHPAGADQRHDFVRSEMNAWREGHRRRRLAGRAEFHHGLRERARIVVGAFARWKNEGCAV